MRRRTRRDFDWYEPTWLGVGNMGQLAEADSDNPAVAATLWVPDPEQRSGWREFYVRKPGAEPKPDRPIGFRKPGAA